MTLSNAQKQWHPIAASTDLVYRHVFHAQLFGRELAVWRADDGHVNAWENRCLHRGVRLSIGVNDGRELVCQYHGWRYANRTAGCTYIPAHPADAPARTICNNQYPVKEIDGLIWSCKADDPPEFSTPAFRPGVQLVLRALPINAPADIVALQLLSYLPLATTEEQASSIKTVQHGAYTLCSEVTTDDTTYQLNFFLQPTDSNRTVVRSVLSGLTNNTANNEINLLKTHSQALGLVRESAEQQMQQIDTPAAWEVLIKPVSETLSRMPVGSVKSQSLTRVQVADIQDTATDIKSITLTPLEGQLPTFHSGAHIDVHLPNGMIKQYSLTNGPGQTDRYIIGVKKEPTSEGSSSFIHQSLRTGDVLAISTPRNNFPLRRDAVSTLLIAGGIGITPLLSMAQALNHSSLPFTLHYFIQGESHRAFNDLLRTFKPSLTVHTALDPQQTRSTLQDILKNYQSAHHVYVCGPGPMLDATREIAQQNNWPDEAIHFEYFKNSQQQDNSVPFTVSLARSGLTLQVPSGQSLLEVLRENNIDLPSSCEQGACGTCKVAVTDGTPLHQDVYLNQAEQLRGDCMMTCVSRAKTASLTLDI